MDITNLLAEFGFQKIIGLVFLFVLETTLWTYQVNLVAFKQPNLSPWFLRDFLGFFGMVFSIPS
jgi:hypothetical protein